MHTLKQIFHTFFFDHSISNTNPHIMANNDFLKKSPIARYTDLKKGKKKIIIIKIKTSYSCNF